MAPPPAPKPRKQRRTWPQRLTIVVVGVAAFACFAAAGVLAGGQWVLSQRNLTPLAQTTSQRSGASDPQVVVPERSTSGSTDSGSSSSGGVPTLPPTTVGDAPLLLAEPDAANFLVVGADNG